MLRVWLMMGIGVVTLVVSGLVTTMARAQAGPDPVAVITAYETARNRRDLDAALAYFADDAIITQRNTTFAGKEDLRKFLDNVSTRSRFVVVTDRHINGNRVTWSERSGAATPSQQAATQGPAQTQPTQGQQAQSLNALAAANTNANTVSVNVEAIVVDGKIRAVAYLAPNQAQRLDPSLEGRAQLPAAVGLGAVAVLMLGTVVLASVSVRRGSPAVSSLHGRLMQDLRGWSAARQSL